MNSYSKSQWVDGFARELIPHIAECQENGIRLRVEQEKDILPHPLHSYGESLNYTSRLFSALPLERCESKIRQKQRLLEVMSFKHLEANAMF